jgi:Flp pilus assembly protein TadG
MPSRVPGLPIRALPAAGLADRERGSMSVEIAVVAPALVLLLLIVALGGRLVESQNAIDGAARDAARAASLARYPGTGALGATSLAQQAAAGDLSGFCTGANLNVTVTGFPALDQPAQLGDNVTVTVNCSVDTIPFGVLGLGARHEMTGTAVAPLDPFMCRGTEC